MKKRRIDNGIFELKPPEVKKKGDPYFMAICKEWGLLPMPEFQFAKDEKRLWRTDYFFENKVTGVRVALEIEGGIYEGQRGGKGGHTTVSGFKKDVEKYNMYALKGILLYRVLPDDLIKTKTFEDIKKILNKKNQ